VAAAVRDRGADGVNLDFEPIVSGYAEEFTALVRSVRAELDAIAPGYQLTFDTTGYIGNYPLEAATAPGGADAIFIMGYDYRGSSSSSAGSISPLTGPVYDLTDTVAAYAARVPPSKLILGVPYYGRAWSTSSDLHMRQHLGTQYGTSVTAIYTTAMDLVAENGRRWDATDQSPWTAYQRETCTSTYGCVTAWRQLWYDDAESLKLRYDLVNGYNLRGAGIWALGYDGSRTELNEALAVKFQYSPVGPPCRGRPVRHRGDDQRLQLRAGRRRRVRRDRRELPRRAGRGGRGRQPRRAAPARHARYDPGRHGGRAGPACTGAYRDPWLDRRRERQRRAGPGSVRDRLSGRPRVRYRRDATGPHRTHT
jgi:hypothetical protein